jgi:hypothetical protein
MTPPFAVPNEVPTHGYEYGADQIEGGIDCWKIGDCYHVEALNR